MDVRCERCHTEYELEDTSVTDEATEVQCTACGNTFLVTRPAGAPPTAAAEPSPSPADWLLETSDGQTHRFRNLTSLQKWIIERKVTREDRISRTGQAWRRLGEIVELAPFFDVVDEADRARAAAMAGGGLKTRPARRPSPPRGIPPAAPTPRENSQVRADAMMLTPTPEPSEVTALVRLRPGVTALKLIFAMSIAGGVAYVGITQLWGNVRSSRTELGPPPATPKAPPRPAPAPTSPAPDAEAPDVEAPAVPAAEPVPAPPSDELKADSPSYAKLVAEADHLIENGSTDRAQRLYDKALKLRPGGAEALAGLGYAALDRGNGSQAFSFFKRALAADGGFGPALFGLAEAHRAAGDEDLALEHYRKYLAADPGGTDASAARRQIKTLEAKQAAKVPTP